MPKRLTRRKRPGKPEYEQIRVNAPNLVWSVDFQYDVTTNGTPFKIASMVDEHTRESLLSLVDRSITATALVTELKNLIALRGKPVMIRCDNGPEFLTKALRQFCGTEVKIGYIPPGQPWKNGYIESFNSRLRDECLNMEYFDSILHARAIINHWKEQYNKTHLHSALGYQTPGTYAQSLKTPQL